MEPGTRVNSQRPDSTRHSLTRSHKPLRDYPIPARTHTHKPSRESPISVEETLRTEASRVSVTATAAVGIAAASDLLFGEFPERVHPVAVFGRVVSRFDQAWEAPRMVGVLLAGVFPIAAATTSWVAVALGERVSPLLGVAIAGAVLFATTSLRMLVSVSTAVIDQTRDELDAARDRVTALVGRETVGLSGAHLRSAALESAAENLADGLVAPLVAFSLGATISLSAGAAAAAWVKGVNTLDSMLGYQSEPLGWASARLDDIVMWLPARVTAGCLALAGRSLGALSRARQWQALPASPNSGWPMATIAAVTNVRLEKRGAYTLNPDANLPTVRQAHRGVRTVALAGVLAVVLAGVISWF